MTNYKQLEALPNEIVVVCEKNGSDSTIFTDGKRYDAVRSNGIVFTVIDDIGYARHFIPNERCPHLVKEFGPRCTYLASQKSVGQFNVVEA